ncbi:hypothetical protein EJB05_39004, partial [Eragrostis curvula]
MPGRQRRGTAPHAGTASRARPRLARAAPAELRTAAASPCLRHLAHAAPVEPRPAPPSRSLARVRAQPVVNVNANPEVVNAAQVATVNDVPNARSLSNEVDADWTEVKHKGYTKYKSRREKVQKSMDVSTGPSCLLSASLDLRSSMLIVICELGPTESSFGWLLSANLSYEVLYWLVVICELGPTEYYIVVLVCYPSDICFSFSGLFRDSLDYDWNRLNDWEWPVVGAMPCPVPRPSSSAESTMLGTTHSLPILGEDNEIDHRDIIDKRRTKKNTMRGGLFGDTDGVLKNILEGPASPRRIQGALRIAPRGFRP